MEKSMFWEWERGSVRGKFDDYYKNKDIKSESYYTKRSCFHRLV